MLYEICLGPISGFVEFRPKMTALIGSNNAGLGEYKCSVQNLHYLELGLTCHMVLF
jgi:hypothetical protein